MSTSERLFGVLVTYRRPDDLEQFLRSIEGQTRPLEHLVVVDNGGDAEEIVRELAPGATYLRSGENLGPAGGIARGLARVLEIADDGDWVFTFDDDDWTPDLTLFARLADFATKMHEIDGTTAAVGRSGVRFDLQRGVIVRPEDEELRGAVACDAVAGNQFPLYSVAAVRSVGLFRSELFYGFEELEYGLRLRSAGFHVYVEGELWYEARDRLGLLAVDKRPKWWFDDAPTWRRYYSIRNLIVILRERGLRLTAVRVTTVTAIGKPLANLAWAPRPALAHLRLGLRAARDGWAGRLGRTVDPEADRSNR